MKLKQSALDKALAVTSYFEGGYCAIAGNGDGQGLSLGFLQWNFGQRTLQPLLLRLFNEYPEVPQNYLPEGGRWLLDALKNGWIMDWAAQIQANNKVVEPWNSALYDLCSTPEFQCIQNDAAQPYVYYAINMCESFGLTTDRAFSLMLDISVQCGTLNGYELAEPTYQEKLEAVVNVAVSRCNPKWQEDVRKRKLAIVYNCNMGRGWNDSVSFDDETAFEEEKVQTEPKSSVGIETPVTPVTKDWKAILNEKVSEPDAWIRAIEAAQENSNLGDLEIIRYLPELIVKIGG